MPVAKLDQATGDSGGFVVPSSVRVPLSESFRILGRCGSHSRTRSGSTPSKPSTTTLNSVLRAAVPPRQEGIATTVSNRIARARRKSIIGLDYSTHYRPSPGESSLHGLEWRIGPPSGTGGFMYTESNECSSPLRAQSNRAPPRRKCEDSFV